MADLSTTAATLSQRNSAYSGAVPHGIQGLYTFQSAATILRISYDLEELDSAVVSVDSDGHVATAKEAILKDFMEQINVLERDLYTEAKAATSRTGDLDQDVQVQSYVVVVEGLDGSGKSSLVEHLTSTLQQQYQKQPHDLSFQARAWTTPTASMTHIRPVFDKRGGPVARAFYMVSNYMLQYELRQWHLEVGQLLQKQNITRVVLLAIVDRWYTSTVAYSVAWKNTQDDISSVDALDESIFRWPVNLRSPDLLFLLQVDDETRKTRVRVRNTGSGGDAAQAKETDLIKNYNPWDERLDKDVNLGTRIMRSFERVADGLTTASNPGTVTTSPITTSIVVRLDANQTQQDVLKDGLRAVEEQLLRASLARQHRPMTIVLTGTHCAGKAIIGKIIAKTLGCAYQPELGDILRDRPHLVPGGHLIGDGSGDSSSKKSWDERIFEAEKIRDEQALPNHGSRIVETWHIGNLAWAQLRLNNARAQNDNPNNDDDTTTTTSSSDAGEEHYQRAKAAIQQEMSTRRCVVAVHLTIRPEDSIRRRKLDAQNTTRLPLSAEEEAHECTIMHQALEVGGRENLTRLQAELEFPVLVVDNSVDSNLGATRRKIVNFIQSNQ